MRYEINKEKKKQARSIIRKLKKKIEMWQKEKEDAIISREKHPAKYYMSISLRVKNADKLIKEYEDRITEIKKAIKDGHIKI